MISEQVIEFETIEKDIVKIIGDQGCVLYPKPKEQND